VLRLAVTTKEMTMTAQNGIPSSTSSDRIDSLKSNLKGVAQQVSTAAAAFKERASETKSHVAAGARMLGVRLGQAIKDHPVAAIGIALGAGYLVIRLIRR
jgi:ElaB/YqjD/DUF883 family membrane-anchored ribosome-binding protein